jgi:hypothetical protein
MIEVRGERTGTGAVGDGGNVGLGFIRALVWWVFLTAGFVVCLPPTCTKKGDKKNRMIRSR